MGFPRSAGQSWTYRLMAVFVAIVVGLSLASGTGTNVRAQSVGTHVPEGLSLVGWCGAPTTTGDLIDEFPFNQIWLFNNGSNAYDSDAAALPGPLRNNLEIPTGAGFFASADEAFDIPIELVALELQVPPGLNIVAQCDADTDTSDVFEFYPVQQLWTFENGAFNSDSTLLPAPLRNPFDLPVGTGMFINATESFFLEGFGEFDGGPIDEGPVDEGPVDEGPVDEGQVNSFDDLRIVDLGVVPAGGGTFTVDVLEGEGSFLAYAQAPGIDDQIIITDVTGPDGASILTDLIPDGRQGEGEATVLVPLTDATPLTPGTYTVTVQSDEETTVGAIIKRATNGAAQVLNVKFWVATASDEIADAAGRATVEGIFRERGNTIFGGANLSIGSIEFIDAPAEISRTLDLPSSGNDTTQRALCSAMEDAFPQERFLHFVLVDSVVDPDDQGGVTLGNAAGIPGAVLVAGSRTSCVVVTANAGGVTLAGNATTAWHEAGHLLGLNHSTEATGDFFDFIPDTPECDISNDADGDGSVDQSECGDVDFMFHDTDNTGMSEDQGNFLAGHPMFQPAG